MILKTVCALVALLLELFNSYGDGEFDWSNGYAPSLHIILDSMFVLKDVTVETYIGDTNMFLV